MTTEKITTITRPKCETEIIYIPLDHGYVEVGDERFLVPQAVCDLLYVYENTPFATWHMRAVKAEAELTTLKERIADDDLANRIARDCHDPDHDKRWCPTCEARSDGIDEYQHALQEGK